jgi:hypothetical protein
VAGAVLVASFAAALFLFLGLGSSSPGWGVASLLTLGLIGVGYAVARSQWALLTGAVVATVAGLLGTSRSLADEFSSVVARDGQLQVQPFDIGPAVLEFREVRVYAPGHPLHNSCVTLLGVGPEHAIVYADVPNDSIHNYTNEVWRLPHGDAQLVYFHTGGLCRTPVGYTFEEHWPDDRPVTSEDRSASP